MRILSVLVMLAFAATAAAQQTVTVTAPESVSSVRTEGYATNLKLREERRVGVGAQLGGTAGALGLLLELNIEDQNAALVGVGFGDGYGTFSVSWKHSFEGMYFTPYATAGWSRWYNSAGKPASNHILEGMLTSDEQIDGRFGLDLVAAGGGMQYHQLDGEFAGATIFGEINLMVSPFRGKILPTAGAGVSYFF